MARFMTAFRLPQGVKLPDNLNSELIRRVHPTDTRKIDRIKALTGSGSVDFTKGPIFLGPVASFSGALDWLEKSEIDVLGYELLGSPEVNLGASRQPVAARAA